MRWLTLGLLLTCGCSAVIGQAHETMSSAVDLFRDTEIEQVYVDLMTSEKDDVQWICQASYLASEALIRLCPDKQWQQALEQIIQIGKEICPWLIRLVPRDLCGQHDISPSP